MEKENKPSPADKQSEKKPTPPGGGNLVWYMLGLGVLLLLMVTIFNSGTQLKIGWSDLIKLIEATDEEGTGTGSVDIVDTSTTQPVRNRLSDLNDIQIGSSYVTAKVTRQRFKQTTSRGSNGEPEFKEFGEPEKNV